MNQSKQISCGVFFCLLVFGFHQGHAQKVKYKDLYELLRTKQYETAEPFLKRYLVEEDDNPNAYLFMGIIYQEKSGKADLLKQTDMMLNDIDSSIFFYDKAYKTITEKELKRNKDYYEAYNRRDLRTGEYGVTLSDVQFDLQKKLESLKERTGIVSAAKKYFSGMQIFYDSAQQIFAGMQSTAPDEMQFYLRSDEPTLQQLTTLATTADSAVLSFNSYKTQATALGRTTYNHSLNLVEISDFPHEGTSKPDYYQDNLKLWDYKKFATKAHKIVQDDILPMQKNLLAYDIEINKLREKLGHDSVSVKDDLTKVIDKLFIAQMKKYDADPMPLDLFALKVGELEYKSTLLEDRKMADSADVYFRMNIAANELKEVNHLDSIATKLASRNLDEDIKNYASFVSNTFHSDALLKGYVRTVKDYADREYASKTSEFSSRQRSLNWLIDGSDSIPLMTEKKTVKFHPMVTVNEKYTAGLVWNDTTKSAKGYFYAINPARTASLKVRFPIDSVNIKRDIIDSVKMLSVSDPQGQVFFVMVCRLSKVNNVYPSTVSKIYGSDGLAWCNNVKLTGRPEDIVMDADTGAIKITYGPNAPPLVIDKNGKIPK